MKKQGHQETEVQTRSARPFFSDLPTGRSKSSLLSHLQTSLPSHETHEAWVDLTFTGFWNLTPRRFQRLFLWRLNLAPGKIQDSGLQLLHVLHKPDSRLRHASTKFSRLSPTEFTTSCQQELETNCPFKEFHGNPETAQCSISSSSCSTKERKGSR